MEPGITLGVKTTPLDRVGIYIPGGRAAYPIHGPYDHRGGPRCRSP